MIMLVSPDAMHIDFSFHWQFLFKNISFSRHYDGPILKKKLFVCTRVTHLLIFRHMLSMQLTDPTLWKQVSVLQYVVEERSGGGQGRKVKCSLFSTSENELKLFLVPAAAYNGKNEELPLPKKWAVRNNWCAISATSLARSISQTAWEPGSLLGCSILKGTLAFLLLNCCSSCLAEFTRQPQPWMQLTGNIHVLANVCGLCVKAPWLKLVTAFSKIILIFHVSLPQSCSPLFCFMETYGEWGRKDRSFNTRSYYMRLTKKVRSKKPI